METETHYHTVYVMVIAVEIIFNSKLNIFHEDGSEALQLSVAQ